MSRNSQNRMSKSTPQNPQDPFKDSRPSRTRFNASPHPPPSPIPRSAASPIPGYPPSNVTSTVRYGDSPGGGYFGSPQRQRAGRGDGGVTIAGQHMPWTGGDEDDESRPLTSV